ncbi:hypothetical protein PQR67_13755 [Paraburkholderia fungorum]|uniref:hypothetical protein n=1 Tax=Paraburkholderia fungorum TaxID=134537 RepID=UPI0038B9D303
MLRFHLDFFLVTSGEVAVGKRAIKICNFLGDLSFPLYLFRIPAMLVALKLGSNRFVITLASMILLSTAALYLVGYPSRKLFGRKSSTRTRAQKDPPPDSALPQWDFDVWPYRAQMVIPWLCKMGQPWIAIHATCIGKVIVNLTNV